MAKVSTRLGKVLTIAILSFMLNACAGTGTKDMGIIRQAADDASATAIFVLRDTGYPGSANLVNVVLDGVTIANLGQGETVTYPVEPGQHILTANFPGLGGIGLNEPVATFDVEGKDKKFFTIQMRTGLLVNTLNFLEITRDSYFSTTSQR